MWYPASRDLTSKPSSESINHTLFSVRYGYFVGWSGVARFLAGTEQRWVMVCWLMLDGWLSTACLLWNLQYNVNMLFVNLSGHHHIRSNLINHTRKLTIMRCAFLQGWYNATLSPYSVIKLWQITVTTVQNITSPKTRMFRILIPHTCDTIATTN